jgi:hypothetical protein
VTRILPSIAAFMLTTAAACAHAQELQLPPDPPPQAPPAAAPAAPPPAQPQQRPDALSMSKEKLQRIYHIRQLEGVLTNAVKAGASTMAYQLQMAEPSLFVTTTARTRGFELDGYGVFFDVDVPAMLQSAVFSVQARQEYVESLRAAVADVKVNPAMRRVAQIELDRLQRQLGLGPAMPSQPVAAPQPAAQGVVTAQTTDLPATGDARMVSGPVAPLPDVRDPNERYTEAIKDKLIDAMLAYGMALRLGDEEWLVIAARATSGDLMPGQLDDAASILLRIKGADLNAHATQKITREEVIKRIEIKIG